MKIYVSILYLTTIPIYQGHFEAFFKFSAHGHIKHLGGKTWRIFIKLVKDKQTYSTFDGVIL